MYNHPEIKVQGTPNVKLNQLDNGDLIDLAEGYLNYVRRK